MRSLVGDAFRRDYCTVGRLPIALIDHVHDRDVDVDADHVIDAEPDEHEIPENRSLLDVNII